MHSAPPYEQYSKTGGFSLIELIITIMVVLTVFVGVIGIFRIGVEILSLNKARGAALTLAQEQIEFIRSLAYSAVGTDGGIPSGSIPQTETVVLNNISFERRTFIQYYDDPADGLDAGDATGIITDYKRAKVEVSWDQEGEMRSVSLVSNVVPRGVESLVPGGTLRITVIDATGAPVQNAEVSVQNSTVSPSVNLTAFTNAAGVVLLPGAPEGSGYEISAGRLGYSSAQTYPASGSNPNPNPAHVSVVLDTTSSITLAIDRVATLAILTREPLLFDAHDDDFADTSGLSAQATTTVAANQLQLADTAGVFASSGSARSIAIAPSLLARWEQMQFTDTRPLDTDVLYRLWYDTGGGFALVPDGDLPGNATGFSSGPVDLSILSPTTYDTLQLEALLTTADTATTSAVLSWSLSYAEALVPVGSVPFTLTGGKTIGEDASSNPIPKYDQAHTTDAFGELSVVDLEWDSYTITVDPSTGWMIADICPPQPRGIAPNENATTEIGVVPNTTHALRVVVADTNDDVVEGATVRLLRGATGYDETELTTPCGQGLFSGIATADDYSLEVSKSGFTTTTLSDIEIDGKTVITVVLQP